MSNKTATPARMRQRASPRKFEASAPLHSLQRLEAFQAANAHVFPSVPSLRWFYRQHRAALLEAGAVVEITGRLLINTRVFSRVALEIGSRVAARRARQVKA